LANKKLKASGIDFFLSTCLSDIEFAMSSVDPTILRKEKTGDALVLALTIEALKQPERKSSRKFLQQFLPEFHKHNLLVESSPDLFGKYWSTLQEVETFSEFIIGMSTVMAQHYGDVERVK